MDNPKRRLSDNGTLNGFKIPYQDVVKIVAVIITGATMYYALEKRVSFTEYRVDEIREDMKYVKRTLTKIAREVGAINLPTEAGKE